MEIWHDREKFVLFKVTFAPYKFELTEGRMRPYAPLPKLRPCPLGPRDKLERSIKILFVKIFMKLKTILYINTLGLKLNQLFIEFSGL